MAKTKSSGERDAIIIPLSDMHSGSNYALFLDRFWEGKNGLNHHATSKQQIIRAKWEEAKKEIALKLWFGNGSRYDSIGRVQFLTGRILFASGFYNF